MDRFDVPWVVALLVLSLSVAVRAGDLDAMANVDMWMFWNRRIIRFIHGFESGNLQDTVQSHHPGVSFMWLAGLLWKAFRVVDAPLDAYKLKLAVWPVACVGSIFPVASYGLMRKLLGRRRRLLSFVAAVLLATEPMLVAHSRNAHLDMLVTSFAWIAVLAALIARRQLSLRWASLSGVLLGFALLSKLSAAGYALGIAAVFVVAFVQLGRDRVRMVCTLTLIAGVAALVIVAVWPAMWVSPMATVERIHEGLSEEVNKTGPFMFLGQAGKLHLPFWIYGFFAVHLVTPEALLPGLMLIVTGRWLDGRTRQFVREATLAALPLVILVLKSNHVGNRYLVPILPLFCTLAAVAIVQVMQLAHAAVRRPPARFMIAGALLALFGGRTFRVTALYPLPIAYCSSWTGVDCSDVFHTGWGEGMKEAALFAAEIKKARGPYGALTVYGSAYATTMSVWTPIRMTKDLEEAQLLVQYLPDQQRKLASSLKLDAYVKEHALAPIHEVKLRGRTYVTIYPGPRH